MKKIFLTAIALLTMASTQVFGMYGASSDWIDFLVHGNRFKATMKQLGFVLGNGTIKGTFGFLSGDSYGKLLNSDGGLYYDFKPTISMGLGYTSSLISVGVGYNATISPNRWTKYNGKADGKKTEAVAHTPVLTLTALDNAFRMAIPIQVVHLADKDGNGNKGNVTAVSMDAQFRYFPGLAALSQVRLYLKYGNYSYQYKVGDTKDKGKFAESFGFDFRLWFGSVMIEEVSLTPTFKIQYNTALGKQHNQTKVTALDVLNDAAGVFGNLEGFLQGNRVSPSDYSTGATWKQSAWNLTITPGFDLSASSDIVSFTVSSSLGLKIEQKGDANSKVKEIYGLSYGVWVDMDITPIKNLDWYFGIEIGNDSSPVSFDAGTGVTWHLPVL